ncbi:MAG: DUF6267 family protein [Methanogenium sp.]|jgi:hypothetical protein
MKIKKITKLKEMYPECDITTKNENFFVKVGNKYILIHNSPSTVFGYDENNRFFVSTKSAFSKNPKLAYNNQDIDILFGSPGLKEKLKYSLKYLPKIIDSGVYQGDLMFTTGDKQVQIINGERVISFTPNTITYTVPDDDSDLAKEIKRSKIGIVIHTKYIDGNFDKISFDVDKSMFKKSPDVWVQDAIIPDVSGLVNFDPRELADIEIKTIELEKISNNLQPKFFSEMKKLGLDIMYKTFSNFYVRKGQLVRDPEDGFINFRNFVQDYYQKEIDKLKKEESKAKKKSALMEILDFFKKYIKQIILLFNTNIILTSIKNVIIQKLRQIKSIGTFIQKGNDFEVSNPEGFCVIDNDGSVLKLVDRLDFSAANFLNPKFKR